MWLFSLLYSKCKAELYQSYELGAHGVPSRSTPNASGLQTS